MVSLREMEQGQGSSFILVEAHQKPVRISLCCAELCKTAVLERKFKAGCPVPDPTRHWQAHPSSDCASPFFQETSQGGHVSLDVGEQRQEVGNLLSLQLCPPVTTWGRSLLGAVPGGEHSRDNARVQHAWGVVCVPSPGNGTWTQLKARASIPLGMQ